jgi:hypothetical protein
MRSFIGVLSFCYWRNFCYFGAIQVKATITGPHTASSTFEIA